MENLSAKIKYGMKWQFYSYVIGQAIYFINGIILARILSPKDFGIYGMALVLSNFAFMFWNLGVDSAIIQKKGVETSDLNNVFSISLLMGIVCFLMTWWLAPAFALFFEEPSVKLLSRLIGTTFIIYAVDRVYSALLDKNFKFREVGIINLMNPIFYAVVTIPLSLNGFGPLSFAFGIIAGCLGMVILRIYYGMKLFGWRPRFELSGGRSKGLLKFGLGITGANVVSYFSVELPKILIGRMLGAIDLGFYYRANNLSGMPLRKVQGNVVKVLLPAFSGVQDDKKKTREWFLKFNFFTYALLVPFLMFFIFFPKEVIVGIFGVKWSPAIPLLLWSSLAVLVGASDMYYSSILKAIGKPFLNLLVESAKILPLLVAVFFLRKVGLIGFVKVLFIASIAGSLLYISLLCRERILLFSDQIISMIEPCVVSLVAIWGILLARSSLVQFARTEELQFLFLFGAYAVLVGAFYLYRFFKRPLVGYLHFNMNNVLKF